MFYWISLKRNVIIWERDLRVDFAEVLLILVCGVVDIRFLWSYEDQLIWGDLNHVAVFLKRLLDCPWMFPNELVV